MSFLSRIMVLKSQAHFSAGVYNRFGAPSGMAIEGSRKRKSGQAKSRVGLLIVDVVAWVVLLVIGIAVGDSLLGCGMWAVNCVAWLAILVLHIYCIIQAVGGKRPRIPVVTDFAEKSL